MARVLILGGGFGGAAAAAALRRLAPDHETVLVERQLESYLCGVNPAVIVGSADPLFRSIAELADLGIDWIHAEVENLNLDERVVVTSSGDVTWDHLVIALGVSYDWEAVPGSGERYSFYDRESALRLRSRLEDFDGGSIVIGIGGRPYRCPPAPFEAALMIDDYLREKGARDRSSITVAIPEPAPLGVGGPEVSARIRGILDKAGIELRTGVRATAVRSDSIEFSDGVSLKADISIIVPVHRLPPVVEASGLAGDKPFVPVDRETLETVVSNVYAIGDVNGIPVGENAAIPKAGVFASGQGRHVAEVIGAKLGVCADPGAYDGVGHCFLMLGYDTGAQVGGAFLAPDGPEVDLDEPSKAGRQAKDQWEAAWARFDI